MADARPGFDEVGAPQLKGAPRRFGLASIGRTMPDGRVEPYIDRLYLIRTRFFQVQLHAIHREDLDRWPHDHPRGFVSIVLAGGYLERWARLPRGEHYRAALLAGDMAPMPWWNAWQRDRRVRRVSYHRADDLHMIVSLDRTPTWTLLLLGPRGRRWGFLTDEGWVDASEGVAEPYGRPRLRDLLPRLRRRG